MTDEATELLFSYGTLQLEAVQIGTFGRVLAGAPDALLGHRLDKIPIRDPEVLRLSGTAHHLIVRPTTQVSAPVPGMVFRITPAELARADSYETDDYERVRVTLASGLSAWVYAAAAGPAWRIELLEAPRVVLIDGAGWLSMAELLTRAAQAMAFGHDHDCLRFVFDDRAIVPRVSTAEIYRLPVEFEKLGWVRHMCVANVYDASRPDAAADYRVFSGLSVNRGFKYCLFTELEPAVSWAGTA